MINPSEFEQNSFRTKEIATGVEVVMGKLKGKDSMVAQSYHFDKKEFTPTEAEGWLRKNGVTAVEFTPAKSEQKADEEKAGARNSAADLATINRLHAMTHEMRHHLESLGATQTYPIFRETKADDESDPWLDEWKGIQV